MDTPFPELNSAGHCEGGEVFWIARVMQTANLHHESMLFAKASASFPSLAWVCHVP